MSEVWRTGTSPGTNGRTIYRHDAATEGHGELIGVMFSSGDAALVVRSVNRLLYDRKAAGDEQS